MREVRQGTHRDCEGRKGKQMDAQNKTGLGKVGHGGYLGEWKE
jgi:hypothetical protein